MMPAPADGNFSSIDTTSWGEVLARFNVEDELRADPRFDLMCTAVGKQMAYGAICCLWEIGQAYWKRDKSLIPTHIAEQLPNILELTRTQFVKKEDGGYYCAGAKDRWQFLVRNSVAGKRSAEVRKEKYGTAQPKKAAKRSNIARTRPNKVEHAEGSSSSSSSSSSSNSGSSGLRPPAAVSPKALRDEVWKKYSDAYFARYGTEPVRNAQVNSKIKLLAERLGDEAKDVVEFYVTHNNAFYVRTMHPIGACLKDAEGLRTQWATGRMVSQKEANQADSSTALASQIKKIREGSI